MTDFHSEIFANFAYPSPRQTLVPLLWVQFHALLTCDYKFSQSSFESKFLLNLGLMALTQLRVGLYY